MSRKPKGTQLQLRRKKVAKNRYTYQRSLAYIYLIHMKHSVWGSCYKVGVSINPHQRLSSLAKESGSLVTLINLQEGNAYSIYTLEIDIHERYQTRRKFKGYRSDLFGGYTECFNLSKEELTTVDNTIDSLQHADISVRSKQIREIGETEWEYCTDSWYNHCNMSPLYDTRTIMEIPS